MGKLLGRAPSFGFFCLGFLKSTRSLNPLVLILDGCSFHYAHIWRNSGTEREREIKEMNKDICVQCSCVTPVV